MRLLQCHSNGDLTFREFGNKNTPKYAILSHTWATDNEEEVSYQDVKAGIGKSKAGYKKIQFCADKAASDGLQYFWVDTCCIDKTNNTELSTAINSMFRWYQQATKCYVYLTDVYVGDESVDAQAFPITWGNTFRRSVWFSRGWTLQELLAPATVEFFSANGKNLGNKISLEQDIHEITGIPTRALRKYRLEEFSNDDRMSWVKKRDTKIEEDKAYCLLGIFGVFLSPIYGEGEDHAFRRLKKEIEGRPIQPHESGVAQAQDALVTSQYPGLQNKPSIGRGGSLRSFEENYTVCLRSLGFSTLQARQNDVASAHLNTCDWLFKTTEFYKWRDQIDLADHNGVLWLKGKPGAGKSTLMKHMLHYYKQELGDHLVVAYFFNARGEQLEKTALGLLRSIVYQLMQGDDTIRDHFMIRFHEKQTMHEAGKLEWWMSDLRDFIISEIMQRYLRPTLLLIDALDECSDSDVQDVVDMLEILSVKAVQSKTMLRICLSSRHYPLIDMKKKLELTVEKNEQHRQDIIKYVSDKLEVEDENIKQAIQEKADGVFLWAVLVIAILNKDARAGRIEEIQKTLSNLPGDLEKVFDSMLAKDETRKAETVLMLQWVLFSSQPLMSEELFIAAMMEVAPRLIEPWNPTRITNKVIQRRITDSSKGLIEVRPGNKSTVQFIHQSVNDFLLRNQRLQRLDPTLASDPSRASYKRLWSCCSEYIKLVDTTWTDGKYMAEVNKKYPFVQYAICSIFNFADKALYEGRLGQKQQTGYRLLNGLYNLFGYPTQEREISQWVQECSSNCFEDWKKFMISSDPDNHNLRIDVNAGLLYMSCENGYQRLVGILLLGQGADVNAQGGQYSNALQAASYRGWQEIVKMLLDAGADVHAQGGFYGNALQAASSEGWQDIVKMLLDAGADVHAQGGFYGNALQAASFQGWPEIVKMLLDAGADVHAQGGLYGNALQAASSGESPEIVKMLLDAGADIHAQGGKYGNALQTASYRGWPETVKMLLDAGADIHAQGGKYGNALQAASLRGSQEIVKMLLDAGADINAQGGEDVPLLLSDNKNIPTQAFENTIKEEAAGKADIRMSLFEEPQFRLLCDKIFAWDRQRFVLNLQRLLESFYHNLSTEAESEAEKAVTRSLQSKRERLRISQGLFDYIQYEQDDVLRADKIDPRDAGEDKKRIEAVGLDTDQDSDTESAISTSTGDYAEEDFPDASELSTILRGTRAFQLLLKDCMMMLLPPELRRVLLSISKEQIWVASEQDPSISNKLKAWVEQSTRMRWDWWPFEPTKRILSGNEFRIFWRCSCGVRQWQEISAEQHEYVEDILARSDDALQLPYWCRKKKVRHALVGRGVFRKALQALPTRLLSQRVPATPALSSSSAGRKYTPQGPVRSGMPQTVGSPSNSDVRFEPRADLQQEGLAISHQDARTASNSASQFVKFILFGIQGSRRTLEPVPQDAAQPHVSRAKRSPNR
ncbi:MAG: hypothetical protein Q9157_006508 [Trypethelium eluteriae]